MSSPELPRLLLLALMYSCAGVFVLFLIVPLVFHVERLLYLRWSRLRWATALGLDGLGPLEAPPYGEAHDWGVSHDGYTLYQSSRERCEVVYVRELAESVSERWSFDVDIDPLDAGMGVIGRRFDDRASLLLRTSAARDDVVAVLELLAEHAPGRDAHMSLEGRRLEVRFSRGRVFSRGVHARAVESRRVVLDALDALALDLARLADRYEGGPAVALAQKVLDTPRLRNEALAELVSGYPTSPELARLLEVAFTRDDPDLWRRTTLFAVDPRAWDVDDDPASHLHARVCAFGLLPVGPGRVAFARDLVTRCGFDTLMTCLKGEGDHTGPPELHMDHDTWSPRLARRDALDSLIEDTLDVITKEQWFMLLEIKGVHSETGHGEWVRSLEVPRDYALEGLVRSRYNADDWLGLLHGDGASDVVDAIMRRLELTLGDRTEPFDLNTEVYDHYVVGCLCDALADRSAHRALPLMRRAAELEADGAGSPFGRAVTRLVEDLGDDFVGGMTVAHEAPRPHGALSASQDVGALSEVASVTAREVVLFDEGAEHDDEAPRVERRHPVES